MFRKLREKILNTEYHYLYKQKDSDIYIEILEATKFLPEKSPYKRRLWHILNNIPSIPCCELCDNLVKWRGRDGVDYSRFCSNKCISQSPTVRNKYKKTIKEKYGDEVIFKTSTFKKERKNTLLDKYGVEHPLSNKDICDKMLKTMSETLSREGISNVSQRKDVKHKRKITFEREYGGYGVASEEIRKKQQKTLLDKYGVNNPYQIDSNKEKCLEANNHISYSGLRDRCKGSFELLFTEDEWGGRVGSSYDFKCLKCDSFFNHKFDHSKSMPRCFSCEPYMKSKAEIEIKDIIEKYNLSYEMNSRKIISPYELDFYIDELKIAIEFNGLFWHSEESGKKDKNYHLDKTKMCEDAGVQLIHIFEDEWMNKKEIVQSMFLSKMKMNKKVYARKCEIELVSKDAKNCFLNDNHMQGEDKSSICVGLKYDNALVCLMTFGKSRFNKSYEWEMHRFCSLRGFNIIGGASRVLKYFEKNYNPTSLITYADRRYSRGGLYDVLGFSFSHFSKPGYYYFKNSNLRESRIKYQKHKLRKILKSFDENATEWENMKNNGYDRIWDCGNYVFVKNF